jgi:hypothetical protein
VGLCSDVYISQPTAFEKPHWTHCSLSDSSLSVFSKEIYSLYSCSCFGYIQYILVCTRLNVEILTVADNYFLYLHLKLHPIHLEIYVYFITRYPGCKIGLQRFESWPSPYHYDEMRG